MTKQMNHQESGTANLHQINSNTRPILQKSALWFQISQGELIIMPLIILMLKSPPQSFQLNSTLNPSQIQTPLRLNQLMMMKWTICWNSSINKTMNIFWMLTSIWFKLDWLTPLLQNFIQSLLCCFIKMDEKVLQSKIACHNFIGLSQTRPLWNWLMERRDMPKELGLFYVALLTVLFYIQLDQFIIVHVNLPTLSHQVPSHFMSV